MSTQEQEPTLELVRWTPEQRAEVRRRHRRITPKDTRYPAWCDRCEDENWPCPSILYAAALDALDAAAKERDELRSVVSEVSPIAALDLVTSLRVENQHARDMASDLATQVADLRAALTRFAYQSELTTTLVPCPFCGGHYVHEKSCAVIIARSFIARTAPKPAPLRPMDRLLSVKPPLPPKE